jgi:hypothetical protein
MTASLYAAPGQNAHRKDHRMSIVGEPADQAVQNPLTRAGGMLRHLKRPSLWLSGDQDDATDLLAAIKDRQGRLLRDGRHAADPAERAAQPPSPRPLLPDELEVARCL